MFVFAILGFVIKFFAFTVLFNLVVPVLFGWPMVSFFEGFLIFLVLSMFIRF